MAKHIRRLRQATAPAPRIRTIFSDQSAGFFRARFEPSLGLSLCNREKWRCVLVLNSNETQITIILVKTMFGIFKELYRWSYVLIITKTIELLIRQTILKLMGGYFCHLLFIAVTVIVYYYAAKFIYKGNKYTETYNKAVFRGILWVIFANTADYLFFTYLMNFSLRSQIGLYFFWKGNLKIISVLAEFFMPMIIYRKYNRIKKKSKRVSKNKSDSKKSK
jgi:hypothetical protein